MEPTNNTKVFKKFSTVEHEGKRYLYLTMDKNFYDFLLEVDTLNLFSESGSIDSVQQIENLKTIYTGASNPIDFIILPCSEHFEILKDAKSKRKQLAEVFDIMNFNDELVKKNKLQ